MANIDKLIINDPSASEPTNPLEMYVAKINGTYTGDIPEPTNDLEKALAHVAAGGDGGGGSVEDKWGELEINIDPESYVSNLEFSYLDKTGEYIKSNLNILVPVKIPISMNRVMTRPRGVVMLMGINNTENVASVTTNGKEDPYLVSGSAIDANSYLIIIDSAPGNESVTSFAINITLSEDVK